MNNEQLKNRIYNIAHVVTDPKISSNGDLQIRIPRSNVVKEYGVKSHFRNGFYKFMTKVNDPLTKDGCVLHFNRVKKLNKKGELI